MRMNNLGTIITVVGLILLGVLLVLISRQILPKKGQQIVEPPSVELPQLIQVQELLKQARLLFYDSERKEDFLRSKDLLVEASNLLEGLEENYLMLYWKGLIDLELGNWFSVNNEKREAEESFSSSLKAAEKSVTLYDRFSDAHRLVGESLMRLIDFRGTLFAATSGPRARNEIDKALSLDPGNVEAYLARGMWFLFTPGLFGGNLEEAISSFQRAADLAREDHQRFLANLWLGQALAAKGDPLQARTHLAKALEIYPHSVWAKRELEKLEEKK